MGCVFPGHADPDFAEVGIAQNPVSKSGSPSPMP
jgi:hypothetical protein